MYPYYFSIEIEMGNAKKPNEDKKAMDDVDLIPVETVVERNKMVSHVFSL